MTTTTTPAQGNRSAAPGSTHKALTEARVAILQYLAKYRFGTTGQIRRVLQLDKSPQHTLGDLARLREHGFVRSFQLLPDGGGGRPELCWLLQRAGAKALGLTYHNGFDRQPNRDQIDHRDLEIDVELSCGFAEWELIRPRHYNPTNPLPDRTEQANILAEALRQSRFYHINRLDREERGRTGQATMSSYIRDRWRDWEGGNWKFAAPGHANDYVAYWRKPGPAQNQLGVIGQAVVIILPQRNASQKFWASRLELYKRLIKELPVLVIVPNEIEVQATRPVIEAAKPKPTGFQISQKDMLSVNRIGNLYNLLTGFMAQDGEYSQIPSPFR